MALSDSATVGRRIGLITRCSRCSRRMFALWEEERLMVKLPSTFCPRSRVVDDEAHFSFTERKHCHLFDIQLFNNNNCLHDNYQIKIQLIPHFVLIPHRYL
eukprot:Selendium_serpulae@DN2023_c0_g1_i1.p1